MVRRSRLIFPPMACQITFSFINCGNVQSGQIVPGEAGHVTATTRLDGAAPPSTGNGGATDAGMQPEDDGAAPPVDHATPLPLFVADSAPVQVMSDCTPGTYAGTYTANISAGDSGFLSGLLTLKGMLSITLVADHPTPHSGEFNNGVLTVAPGAMMSGTDQFGDKFVAGVSGQLNCQTRMFVGTMSNGTFDILGSDAAAVVLTGSLSATYDPNASPVAMVNGSIFGASSQLGLQGNGTWSATLQ